MNKKFNLRVENDNLIGFPKDFVLIFMGYRILDDPRGLKVNEKMYYVVGVHRMFIKDNDIDFLNKNVFVAFGADCSELDVCFGKSGQKYYENTHGAKGGFVEFLTKQGKYRCLVFSPEEAAVDQLLLKVLMCE